VTADGAGEGQDRKRPQNKKKGGKGKRNMKRNPGGSGAVFGTKVTRNLGVQGVSLVTTNMAHFISLLLVANFLKPSALGTYSLLLFLSGLITQVFHLASKPGTIRRAFGMSDEDEDDDDDDDDSGMAESPQHALGVGLVWSAMLGVLATALVIIFRDPIGSFLLRGDPEAAHLVLWAGVLGGIGVVFKLASITLWLERRPHLFLISDSSRTIFNLIAIVAFLAAGWGVDGAIIGACVGTGASTLLTLFLLRGSYEFAFDIQEAIEITKKGGRRATIITMFWLIQQADVFILSRFVDHTDLGIYKLGSQLGFVVSFLPQGFRMSMRPLRRGAAFRAIKQEYGQKVAYGQILSYFVTLCITAVLLMVLGGELLVQLAPASYAKAAPLIPLTAAAMVMPSMFRTVNGNTSYPSKGKRTFQTLILIAGVIYAGLSFFLAPRIGIYAPPIAMFVGFGIASAWLFIRCQLSSEAIRFPYRQSLVAFALAGITVGLFELTPQVNKFLEIGVIAIFMGFYLFGLLAFRVIPRNHWAALAHVASSAISGRPDRFSPRKGLRALEPDERERLRVAVVEKIPPELFGPAASNGESEAALIGSTTSTNGDFDAADLVRILREAAEHGGVPVIEPNENDAFMAKFLFARMPQASRDATMRRLLSDGAESTDLTVLESLVNHLRKAPPDVWEGVRASESAYRTRRRVVGVHGRRAVRKVADTIVRRL
jgi:O-antigen/teichoic acid export membrane protein